MSHDRNPATYLRTDPDPHAGVAAEHACIALTVATAVIVACWFSIGSPIPPLLFVLVLSWAAALRALLDHADTQRTAAAGDARVVAVMGHVSASGARLELPDGLDGDLRCWEVLAHATIVDPTEGRSSLERATIDGAGYVIVRPVADTNLTTR